MPSKYSHSVVLADFSSRGVIFLPDEQRLKYVNSSPQSQKSVAQVRSRAVRPAPVTHKPLSTLQEGPETPDLERPHLSLSPNPISDQARVRASIQQGESISRPQQLLAYHDRMPRSSPTVNVIPPSEPQSAYERQQAAITGSADVPSGKRAPAQRPPAPQTRRSYTGPLIKIVEPGSYTNSSKTNLTANAPAKLQQKSSKELRPNSMSQPQSSSLSSARLSTVISRKAPEPDTQKTAMTVSNDRKPKKTSGKGARSASQPVREAQRVPLVTKPEAREVMIDSAKKLEKERENLQITIAGDMKRSNSGQSRLSRNTQIWNPQSDVLEFPDFDDFSDRDEAALGYFDVTGKPKSRSRNTSVNSTLIIQRPDTRDRPKTSGQDSDAIPVAFPQAASPREPDRNIPSRTTASSAMDSSRGHLSMSSMSSVSVQNGTTHAESRTKTEPTKLAVPTAAADHPWRLPDIREDHGFSPSIFEDKDADDDDDDKFKLDGIYINKGGVGQISSGKDVSFDNDAASDLSAALPPPITRFKDEEDEFNANMARLFGEGGDYAATKKGNNTNGRSSAKKKGFFSKFRSRSQPPGR